MKTKLIFMVLTLLFVSCNPYPEQDAKILIKSRVPNCIKVDKVCGHGDYIESGTFTYVAIDSFYNTYSFEVDRKGVVIPLYKNSEKIK